ncbi:calcineurin-like phosphoesterase [Phlyctema vagabunda]|uniref:Calcineurin-like phosphoesterase n=1 Tax=Phlyctema vagabunda TaxID=108571 RepID=A0ABR4PP87_9HELO
MAGRRTRFVLLSDTHNATPNGAFKLPKGDVLIHAGDLTNQGSYKELKKTVEWIEKAEFEIKILIAGNHDITLDTEFYAQNGHRFHNQDPQDSAKCRALLEDSSIIWLQHEAKVISLNAADEPHTRFKIFGSPLSPAKGLWGFGYTPAEAQKLWDTIPLDVDIIVTHTPPYMHCDTSREGVATGCKVLGDVLSQVRPRLAVCGHVHEGRGAEVVEWHLDLASDGSKARSVRTWTDPACGNNKLSLVDLTARRGQPLQNDGYIGDSNPTLRNAGAGNFQGKRLLKTDLSFDGFSLASSSAVAPYNAGHVPISTTGREGRRETCVINAAIMASSWPHGQDGKRFNKPIVVDIDLPVWN